MREKLIELLNAVDGICPKDASCYDCEYKDVVHCAIPAKADYLIANGATIPVRCKECDFCYYNSSNGTYRCSTHNGMNRTVEPDDYCSYGERREKDG